MTAEGWIAIGSIAIAANSLVGLVTLWYSRRTERNSNSMKDALVEATKLNAHALGKLEGIAEQKGRQKNDSDHIPG
jgi:hypothetical protein